MSSNVLRNAVLSGLMLGAIAIAAPASAQSITVSIVSITNRSTNDAMNATTTNYPIGLEECASSDVEISLKFMNVPTGKLYLDMWRGQNCNTVEARTNTTVNTCVPLFEDAAVENRQINGRSDPMLTFPLSGMLDCSTNGVQTIWFLASSMTPRATEDVGDAWVSLALQVDVAAPPAPTDVEAGSGESSLSLSWEVSNLQEIFEQRVYGIKGSCDDNPFGDGETTPPEGVVNLQILPPAASATISTSDLDLAVGDEAVLGIQLVDKARNRSTIVSACAMSIETTGFCDAYGDCPNDCAVTAPGRKSRAPLGLAIGALVMVVLARRRRAR